VRLFIKIALLAPLSLALLDAETSEKGQTLPL